MSYIGPIWDLFKGFAHAADPKISVHFRHQIPKVIQFRPQDQLQSISHSQISGIVLFSARDAGRNAVSQLSDFTSVLISDMFFDDASGKTSGQLFANREGFARCYAHQWMRLEKLVSMLSFSARDLKPQIKFFKKTFRNSVRRVICGCNRRRFCCCNKSIFSCHNKTSCREVFRKKSNFSWLLWPKCQLENDLASNL